ncbi:hypothetical protein DPMN_159682 [Dreissena polymorpha]|uniref:Uncharacterized protein n=1 Tax=Dreissena polymorpha TaxID=45954 RepID=A0A9D4ELE0_DREPO|nr:hypothetical protein DPMN_159682 [Dreissena polymorpha]
MLKLAQTDRPTDQQTGQKQYVPHYYKGGNNMKKKKLGRGRGRSSNNMFKKMEGEGMRGRYNLLDRGMFKKKIGGGGGGGIMWEGDIMWVSSDNHLVDRPTDRPT